MRVRGRMRGSLARSGVAAALLACSSPKDLAATEVIAAPSAEAPVLSPADVAQGRLRKAAAEGDFVMVKALLDRGVDINGLDPTDPQRNTALHAAVEPGHFPIAKLLFQRGAHLAAKNAAGQTPLDIARSENHEAIVVLLGMRKAEEALPPEVAATPVDPSKLDPGALIATLEQLADRSQVKPEPTEAAKVELHAQAQVLPAAAPVPSAAPALPEATTATKASTPEEAQRLCAQVETALAQLDDPQIGAALREAGISSEAAQQQLAFARSACQR